MLAEFLYRSKLNTKLYISLSLSVRKVISFLGIVSGNPLICLSARSKAITKEDRMLATDRTQKETADAADAAPTSHSKDVIESVSGHFEFVFSSRIFLHVNIINS